MVEAQLNIFDTIVIGVVGLSTLLAFFRGFVREVLSLAGWVGAAFITLAFFPDVAQMIRPYFGSEVVASGAAALGTYVTALLCISLFTSLIMKYVKEGSDVGVLDNVLGLGFGALRGAFIVSLGFLMLTLVFNKDHYPSWLEEARTRPYAERGAGILAQVAPNYLSEDSKLGEILVRARENAQKEAETASQNGELESKESGISKLKGLLEDPDRKNY